MRSSALIEGERTTMLHVRSDGQVTVFDPHRGSAIRLHITMPIDGGASYGDRTWRLLSQVMVGLARAEDRLTRIDRLVERLKSGWQPVASEIDTEIPQRVLRRAHFAFDAIAYPTIPTFKPADAVARIAESGRVEPTGKILWIDAKRE